jgi:hypothetical protein
MVPLDSKIQNTSPEYSWKDGVISYHLNYMSLSSINEAQIRGAATRGTKVLDHLYMVYN